eukprot:jgi/Chlat1/7448/Chrsp6S07460
MGAGEVGTAGGAGCEGKEIVGFRLPALELQWPQLQLLAGVKQLPWPPQLNWPDGAQAQLAALLKHRPALLRRRRRGGTGFACTTLQVGKSTTQLDSAEEKQRKQRRRAQLAALGFTAWAGLCAGLAAYGVATPLETLKTRIQGIKGLFYGLDAVYFSGLPYSIIMYCTYNPIKKSIARILKPKDRDIPTAAEEFVANSAGAAVAELAGSVAFVPGEVISKRMMEDPTRYRNVLQATTTILQQQGVRGVYVGYLETLVRDLPYTATQFAMFEQLRKMYKDREPTFGERMLMGAAAAFVASVVTLPIDVVKSNVMISRGGESALQITRGLMARGGAQAFFRGFPQYALINMSKWSVSMAVFNTIRGESGGH